MVRASRQPRRQRPDSYIFEMFDDLDLDDSPDDIEKFLSFVRNMTNINIQDEDGDTILAIFMERYMDDDILTSLLELKADPNIQNEQGDAPVHRCNDISTIEILFRYGAEIDIENIYGHTLLSLAVDDEDVEKCKFLLDNGADMNITDGDGTSIYNRALATNDTELIELFKSYRNNRIRQETRELCNDLTDMGMERLGSIVEELGGDDAFTAYVTRMNISDDIIRQVLTNDVELKKLYCSFIRYTLNN